MPTINIKDVSESKIVKLVDLSEDSINKIAEAVVRKIVNAEPVRHGHWVKSLDHYDRYMCSVCGHLTNKESDNYCSCCGAKMDEVTK